MDRSKEIELLSAELADLRTHVRCLWVLAIILTVVLFLSAFARGDDHAAALKDAANFPKGSVAYFTTNHTSGDPEALAAALKFTVCSLTRTTALGRQLPLLVAPGLYRVDLRDLQWSPYYELMALSYPYRQVDGGKKWSLVIRADWFVTYAWDQTKSAGTYSSLLSGKIWREDDDVYRFTGANLETPSTWLHLEDASRVSVQRTRLIASDPTLRGSIWTTYDFRKIDAKNDPLQNLDRNFKHDASELIGQLPKTWPGGIGHLQFYALADAEGKIQQKAPADIVVDSTGTRGIEIVANYSCVVCHEEGLQPFSVNGVRRYIRSQAELFAGHKDRLKIEEQYLLNLDRYLKRWNEDFASTIQAINGLAPAANAQAFRGVYLAYDADLTLENAAKELETNVKTLRLALANYNNAGASLSARASQLAHGVAMPRAAFETEFLILKQAMERWHDLGPDSHNRPD